MHALAKFMSNPSIEHVDGMLDVLRYCLYTKRRGICFKKASVIIPNPLVIDVLARVDADWCKDLESISVSGVLMSLHLPTEITTALRTDDWPHFNVVGWKSIKQDFVALSPAESETGAIAHGVKEVVWMRNVLEEVGVLNPTRPSYILGDNNASILNTNHMRISSAMRHAARLASFTHSHVRDGHIEMRKIGTMVNTSDALTKMLDHVTSEKHCNNVLQYADSALVASHSNKRSFGDLEKS